METAFLPKNFIQNYNITKPGFQLLRPRNFNSRHFADKFEKQPQKYTDEDKIRILEEKGADNNTIFKVLGFDGDKEFERVLEVLDFCKGKSTSVTNCILDLCREEQFDDYVKTFLEYGVDSSEIMNALNLTPSQLKSISNELGKVETLPENYKSKLFDVHVACGAFKNKSAAIILSFKTDGFKPVKDENTDTRYVTIIKRVDENGDVFAQRFEKCDDGTVESHFIGGDKTFCTKADKDNIVEQFEVSSEQIIHTKKSPVIPGNYDCIKYQLSDYDCSLDMLEEIKQGRVKGGEALSKALRNVDGNLIYEENFGDIKRKYVENKEGAEYSIETPFYSFKRTRKKLSDNIIFEIVNGREFTAEFDDKEKIITINDKTIDISSIANPSNIDDTWNIAKKLPLDTVYNLDVAKKWELCDTFFRWDDNAATLWTNDDTAIIAHEVGHAIDITRLQLSKDKDLFKIFEQEEEVFNKEYTYSAGADDMVHLFSGLDEIVAEANLVFAGCTGSMRSQLLFRYFPRTLAHIGQKMF